MKVEVIIPAAGSGVRLKSTLAKPFVKVLGQPLFLYCLQVFESADFIDGIVIVSHENHVKDFEESIVRYGLRKVKAVVVGGATRSESVTKGLKQTDQDTDVIVVHDAARPCVTVSMIKEAVDQAQLCGASVVAVPVKPTLKQVDPSTNRVEKTLDRSKIWEIQTPQAFKKSLLEKAHAQGDLTLATDDASLVEQLGNPVMVVMGTYKNIKVTTPEDIEIAELFLRGTNAD